MSKPNSTKPPMGANPATAPVVNPTNVNDMSDLPKDAVAILVWRKFTGPQPLTIVVTKASWEMNKKAIVNAGMQFLPERIYEFDSLTNPLGRKTTFHLQDVIGWAASVDTGIVAAPPSFKV